MVGLTEIEAPVPTSVPPQLEVYHFQAAAGFVPRLPSVTLKVTALPEQIEAGVADAVVGAVEAG